MVLDDIVNYIDKDKMLYKTSKIIKQCLFSLL